MPAYKDLYDLIKSVIEKEISRVEREFERLEKEIEEETKGIYSPLYSFYESEDSYHYLIDVPNIDMSTIYVKVEKHNLRIRCKDKANREYVLNLRLPKDADENSLKVTRAKWLLRISVKRKSV